MKRVHFLLRFTGIIILLLSTSAASGGAQEGTFSRLFLMRTEKAPLPWRQSSTLVDSAGGVHSAYFTSASIHYAYCPNGCGSPSNWTNTTLSDAGMHDALVFPTLALDGSNRPRMMWFKNDHYYYAECNSGCTQAANWTAVPVTVANQADTIYPETARYFTLDSQGRPRFVCYGTYMDDDYVFHKGIQYTYCDGDCTAASNWHSSIIDAGEWFYDPQIVMNSHDQPRVMGTLDHKNLGYLGCDSGCSVSGNWKLTPLYEIGNDGNFAFRLDSQDRPRVAFYKGDSADANLYYAWGNSSEIGSPDWSISLFMDIPPFDWRTVDLALDSQDVPLFAYASAAGDLNILRCTGGCDTGDPVWEILPVETAADLNSSDPVAPGSGCSVSTWFLEGYPSLALDAAGRPHVSYYARHTQVCQGHTSHDVWGLRFAVGSAAQNGGGERLFLPALLR